MGVGTTHELGGVIAARHQHNAGTAGWLPERQTISCRQAGRDMEEPGPGSQALDKQAGTKPLPPLEPCSAASSIPTLLATHPSPSLQACCHSCRPAMSTARCGPLSFRTLLWPPTTRECLRAWQTAMGCPARRRRLAAATARLLAKCSTCRSGSTGSWGGQGPRMGALPDSWLAALGGLCLGRPVDQVWLRLP